MKMLIATIAAACALAGGPALAKTTVLDFTLTGGSWAHSALGTPFGMPDQPSLTGSLTVDSAFTDGRAFVGLSYVTGSRTWTLADIDIAASQVWYDEFGTPNNFRLAFTAPYNSLSGSVAVIFDGVDGISCNCIDVSGFSTVTGVPEPQTWALMIMGFGLAGAALRQATPRSVRIPA